MAPPDQADRLALFDALYAANSHALHAYFVGRTSEPELARDLLQEASMRLWRNLDSVRDLPPERQRAWLCTIARNLVVDHYRAAASATATHNAVAAQTRALAPTTAPPADTQIVARERLSRVDDAIKRLPDTLRTVLVLQVLGDRTSTEIGELLGRPAGTVRYQLALARRQLAEELQLIDPDERGEEVPS
jgi:RNA polymerase sigma-70 factor (ECF subfamily)